MAGGMVAGPAGRLGTVSKVDDQRGVVGERRWLWPPSPFLAYSGCWSSSLRPSTRSSRWPWGPDPIFEIRCPSGTRSMGPVDVRGSTRRAVHRPARGGLLAHARLRRAATALSLLIGYP